MATKTPLNLAAISEDEFDSKMEKAYKSMKAGKGVSVSQNTALKNICKQYSIELQ